MLQGSTGTEQALRAVGEILQAEGYEESIVVVGGAALNLLGVVNRATRDVDILALGSPTSGGAHILVEPPATLPEPLARAAALTAAQLGLARDWLNTGPALQWRQGLPPGLAQRIDWRRYGSLAVGVADRQDLVFLKLYAAADSTGPSSVHYQDLLALQPSDDQMVAAGEWVNSQDVSPEFHRIVGEVVEHVRRDADRYRR